MTRAAGNERSASIAKHSRVASSTSVRLRKRRPSASASLTKSMLHRVFARVAAGFRTRSNATASVAAAAPASPPRHRPAARASDSPRHPLAEVTDTGADSPSAAATAPASGGARGAPCHRESTGTAATSAHRPCSGRLEARQRGGRPRVEDGRPPLLGRHHSFPNRSFTNCRFSAWSATSRFSWRFSPSSVLSRFAPLDGIPPYFFFQR